MIPSVRTGEQFIVQYVTIHKELNTYLQSILIPYAYGIKFCSQLHFCKAGVNPVTPSKLGLLPVYGKYEYD